MDRPTREEFINGLTHAVGTVMSVIGVAWLCTRIVPENDIPKTIACVVYGVALIAVYYSSSMSHWEPNESRKLFYRRLDQAFIYILIVGSFTPFSVVYLSGAYYSFLLGTMWAIATVGFASKLWLGHRLQSVSIWVYLGLGWMTTLAFVPWLIGVGPGSTVPAGCVWMIVAGGVFYSAGTWFLYQDKKHWYFHAIWHAFVMLGSAIHFWAIAKYVV